MTPQDNQDMLYQFMSFLKTVGAVHHLQFCLTVGKKIGRKTRRKIHIDKILKSTQIFI